jgi:hypothetical protein
MTGSGRRKPNLQSSVYQGSDGKWHSWVTMGVRPDGKPDRRHREGATETEVTRKVRELESKRDARKTSKPGRVPTLAQWMRTFIDEVAPQRVAQSTIDSTYRPKIERWIIPRLGGHRLDQLYPEHPLQVLQLAAERRAGAQHHSANPSHTLPRAQHCGPGRTDRAEPVQAHRRAAV